MKMIENLSFEEAMQELDSLVLRLEGEITLSESLTLYDRGQALLAHCATILEQAKLRLTTADDDGLSLGEADG